MNVLKRSLAEVRKYPSALVGLFLIGVIIFIALYAVVSIPYSEAIRLWRGADDVWIEAPRNARPVWFNWFRSEKLPETIVVRSVDAPENKIVEDYGDGFS